MRDVARQAGFSVATVSHVINKTRFVSEEASQRVLDAMEALDYRSNELARSLRRGQTNTIGLILIDSANPYFAMVGRHVEAVLYEHNYNMILCNTEGDSDREELYLNVLKSKQVDGIIFYGARTDLSALQKYIQADDQPIVVIDQDLSFVGSSAPNLLVDNQQGAYIATQHLYNLGHERIACLAGPENSFAAAERVRGYKKAMNEMGLAITDTLLIPTADFHPPSGYKATLALLDLPQPPTAIFSCNDLMAIGGMSAAHQQGLRIPQDLAFVGYDDIRLSSYTFPQLTTMAQPTRLMAEVAVQMLFERIKNPQLPPHTEKLFSHLVVRDSCGAKL